LKQYKKLPFGNWLSLPYGKDPLALRPNLTIGLPLSVKAPITLYLILSAAILTRNSLKRKMKN